MRRSPSVKDRAASGPGCACRVHHGVRAALVCNGDDQLIGAAQVRCVFRASPAVQICHRISSSYTFDRHGDDDAVPRHADVQPPLLRGDQRCRLFRVGDRQHNAAFIRFNAEQVEHALHGRPAPMERDGQRQAEPLAQVREDLEPLRRDDGDHIIHAASSQSSTMSKSP